MKKCVTCFVGAIAIFVGSFGSTHASKLDSLQEGNQAFKRITHVHSIDPPAGQIADSLDQLKRSAQAGSASAASQIYAGLARCATLAQSNDAARFDAFCSRISEDDILQIGYWLSAAASLGNSDAQYSYAVGGFDAIFGSPIVALKRPDEFAQYRRRSRDYLEGLASQCNVDALFAIALDASASGLIYGDEPELAYKYVAVLNALGAPTGNVSEERLERRMTSGQLFRLRQDAASFLESRCR